MISKNSSRIVPKLQPKVLWYSNNGQVHKEIPNIICLWYKLENGDTVLSARSRSAKPFAQKVASPFIHIICFWRWLYLANESPLLTELTNQNCTEALLMQRWLQSWRHNATWQWSTSNKTASYLCSMSRSSSYFLGVIYPWRFFKVSPCKLVN